MRASSYQRSSLYAGVRIRVGVTLVADAFWLLVPFHGLGSGCRDYFMVGERVRFLITLELLVIIHL